jgi:hypothetical protein
MANAALSTTLGAANAQVGPFDTGDNTAISATVTGTFVGTVTFQVLYDATEGWVNAPCVTRAGAAATSTLTAAGSRFINVSGALSVRALMNPYTSGTAEVTFAASPAISVAAASSGGGGGGAATIAEGADVTEGSTTDAAVTGDNAGTVNGHLRGLTKVSGDNADAGIITDIAGSQTGFLRGAIKQWITYLSRFPAALGGTTAANSLPVTLATDGQFVTSTGSLTETAPATDTASSGLNGRLQRIAQRLTSLIGLFPTALGTTTAANSLPVALSSDGTFATLSGAITETAPATDTASSGLNGRLQRIAQRLTSQIALFPAALVGGRFDVNLGAAPATVTVTGNVGGFSPAAPTCTFTRGANTTAYTIGDEVGTAGTAPTTISVARANGGSGLILGAQVIYSSYAATVPQLVVALFSATVTLAGDNAQLNLSDGDAALCIGIIPLTAAQSGQYSAGAPVSAGNTMFFGAPTAPIEFVAGGGQQTIYAALFTLNAFTPIANSETLVLSLRVEQN